MDIQTHSARGGARQSKGPHTPACGATGAHNIVALIAWNQWKVFKEERLFPCFSS